MILRIRCGILRALQSQIWTLVLLMRKRFGNFSVERLMAVLGFDPIDLLRLVVASPPRRRKRLDGVPLEVFQHITFQNDFGGE